MTRTTSAAVPARKPAAPAKPASPDSLPTRERIVRTAAELFAANGYHATGISEILTAVDLSRGSFYYHIDGKETLLFEICRQQVERMNAVASGIAAGTESPRTRLRTLARSLLRNISDHHAEWTVFFREFAALEAGERRDLILRAREEYEESWLQVLKAGAAQGELITLSGLHVKGILGMLNYTYLWLDPTGRLSAEEIADTFVDLLLGGMDSPSQRRKQV
jgi:AcrR family transcriptional regulator